MSTRRLIFDVGNSATKVALFRDAVIERHLRISNTETDFAVRLEKSLSQFVSSREVSRAGLVSVVPERDGNVREWLQRYPDILLFQVAPGCRLPFEVGYESPTTLGADRLAAAAGAWHDPGRGDRHVISVDAGTAVTFDVVSRDGVFLGGPIAPGPDLLARASRLGTASLPEVERTMPDRIVARSTTEALQVGIMWGFIDAAAGLISRLMEELDGTAYVVATGGWASLLQTHSAGIDRVEPHLVLQGVNRLLDLNH